MASTSKQTAPIDEFAAAAASPAVKTGNAAAPAGAKPVTRNAAGASVGWGRGPVKYDPRKFKFDMRRALITPALKFTVSKADRMDAEDAGLMLHRIHVTLGIEKEEEARIHGFDCALFFQHALNGASVLQPGRGSIRIDGIVIDIAPIKGILGNDIRRFFRAYADEAKDVLHGVLDSFDPMDPESLEQHGQLMQVAAERGLHKYPYLAFDAADACLSLSLEERQAIIASKKYVLASTVNSVDKVYTVGEGHQFKQSIEV